MPGSALKGMATEVPQPGTPFTPYSQPHVSLLSLLSRLSLLGWSVDIIFVDCIALLIWLEWSVLLLLRLMDFSTGRLNARKCCKTMNGDYAAQIG